MTPARYAAAFREFARNRTARQLPANGSAMSVISSISGEITTPGPRTAPILA